MGALVKLSLASRQSQYLRMELTSTAVAKTTASGLGIQLAGGTPIILGGEKDGTELAGTVLKANQRVALHLGKVAPKKYHVLLETNPTLGAYGSVQCPRILEPEDGTDLVVHFRAERQLDLAELPWVLRLYMLD